MKGALVGDEPLLPLKPSGPKDGRPRVPNRSALEGILHVLKSGIPWRMLPNEFGCGGVTCWQVLQPNCSKLLRHTDLRPIHMEPL
jgi:transposase